MLRNFVRATFATMLAILIVFPLFSADSKDDAKKEKENPKKKTTKKKGKEEATKEAAKETPEKGEAKDDSDFGSARKKKEAASDENPAMNKLRNEVKKKMRKDGSYLITLVEQVVEQVAAKDNKQGGPALRTYKQFFVLDKEQATEKVVEWMAESVQREKKPRTRKAKEKAAESGDMPSERGYAVAGPYTEKKLQHAEAQREQLEKEAEQKGWVRRNR